MSNYEASKLADPPLLQSPQSNLYHIWTIGASQSGARNSDPSLSSVSMTDVVTLTNGPLSPDDTGVFIPLVEGDTYDQDEVPQSRSDVESQATGLGQQLKTLLNDNSKVCVTIHYRGGTSLQRLSQGGDESAFGYDQIVSTSNRVKVLADAEDKIYVPIFVIFPSGSGANPYDTALTNIITQVRAGIAANYIGEVQVILNQPRITGSPDIGLDCYDIANSISGVHLGQPYKDVLLPSEIQGDNIHITNHGGRKIGIYNAIALYSIITNGSFEPLDINLSNVTYSSDVITVPILNNIGVLQGSGDFNTTVYDADAAQFIGGTWAVNGSSIEFTITSNKPSGSTNIEIRTGQGTGSLKDSRSNSGVIFNAANASPYPIENYIVRYNHEKALTFEVVEEPEFTATGKVVGINFTGNSVTHTESGYNSISNPNNQTIDLDLDDDSTDSGWNVRIPSAWGATGSDNGETSPDFPDNVTKRYSAGDQVTENYMVLEGLDVDNFYDLWTLHSRKDTDGGTVTIAHEGLTTNSRLINTEDNNPANFATTYNVMKSVKLKPDSNGEILIRMTRGTDGYYRFNASLITEFTQD